MIDSNDIRNLIRVELLDQDNFSWPSIAQDEFESHLLEPEQREFINPESLEIETFWIIADEIPESTTEGKLIIYSEEADLFGLAFKKPDESLEPSSICGLYGSLFDALENM